MIARNGPFVPSVGGHKSAAATLEVVDRSVVLSVVMGRNHQGDLDILQQQCTSINILLMTMIIGMSAASCTQIVFIESKSEFCDWSDLSHASEVSILLRMLASVTRN